LFNKDLNRYSDDYRRQVVDDYDESDDEQECSPQGNLDSSVHKIAATIRQAAFESCISDIEVEDDYTLVKNIWEYLHEFVKKSWVKEAAIISAVLIFKTGLWLAYRSARKQGMEIVNL